MKNYAVGIPIMLLFALSACNLQMPERVRIKASPVLQIPLGMKTDIFTEVVDIDNELASLTDSASPDYIEGLTRLAVEDGQPVTLQLSTDIIDVALSDFADEELSLGEINQTIDPISITVPSLDFPGVVISEGIDSFPLPGDVYIPGINVPGIPEIVGAGSAETPLITTADYTSATFAAGNLVLALTKTGDTGTQAVGRVTGARIMSSGSTVVSASTLPASLSGNVVFNLAGVTLPSAFTVVFDIELTAGGGPAETFEISIISSFSADTAIRAATGIDFSDTISESVQIALDTDDSLDSATISSGQIVFILDLPGSARGWENISAVIDLDLRQGVTVLSSASGSSPLTLDLAGVTVGGGDLTLDYSVTVTGAGASFALDPLVDEVTGSVAAAVDGFSTLVVEDIDFYQSLSIQLEQELVDLVSTVTFENPQLTVSLDNRLPVDITVDVNSTALRVNRSNTFSNGSNESWVIDLLPAGGGDSESVLTIDNLIGREMDFTVSVTSPQDNSGTHQLTLSDVTSGTQYSLAGSVSANLDIASVTINSYTHQDQYPSSTDPGLNLSQIGDVLPGGLEFSGVTATLMLDIDETIGGEKIWLKLWHENAGTREYLVGSELAYQSLTGNSIEIQGLEELINGQPDNLYFYYDLDVTGTTIYISGDDQRISAAFVVTIPMQLNALNEIELLDDNDNPVIGVVAGDLFGRDDADQEEIDDINEMLDMARSLTLHINLANSLIGTDSGTVMICNISAPGTPAFADRKIFINNDMDPVVFSTDDIQAMRNTLLFQPQIDLYLPSGIILLQEGGTVDLGLWIELETDIDHTLDVGGEE